MARIHKLLFESEIEQMELKNGQAMSPATRIQVLLNDPNFNWLRALSQLMAHTDEVLFQKEEITADQMTAIKKGIQNLLIDQTHPEFSSQYRKKLISVPDLMLEHGHLKLALKSVQI